ncbi:alpha/beta hydrolase [Streptomyces bacillaris]|uniref:alpha/beta fold hydrolase n=1 Tax=Streptomyces bacillaris TaxID=68179 RepID=UPI003355E76A
MPQAAVNGIHINFADSGAGEPVLLVMGSGSPGKVWNLHQTPFLNRAGYRTITFDNRGINTLDADQTAFTLADMVADTAALIGRLGIEGCRLVGVSLGAFVVQELIAAHPDIASQAVLIATRGRTDTFRAAMAAAEMTLHDSAVGLPPECEAVMRATQYLSPRTQSSEALISDWLDLLEFPTKNSVGLRAQMKLDLMPDRLSAYQEIKTSTLVISFGDDVLTPPHLGKEVADAIPGSEYREISHCGHLGYLEDPDAVNSEMVRFFGGRDPR